MDENSVDAVVTDPPYGLSFMGKKWDYDVPSVDIWKEVLRVLKPGGHVLSFGGTRTYHRMVVNMEDAGFEIRDQIQWLYGSGFPKSMDISKAIDKAAGAVRENDYKSTTVRKTANSGSHRGTHVCDNCGKFYGSAAANCQCPKSKPATDAAKQWQGWGAALKPAWESICLARKPLEAKLTIAQNVQKWGTGALNIDASRIGYANEKDAKEGRSARASTSKGMEFFSEGEHDQFDRSNRDAIQGRWPANIILDEEAAASLGEPSRFFYVAKASRKERFSYLTCNCKTVKPNAWVLEGQNQKEQTAFTSLQKDICERTLVGSSNLAMSLNGKELTDQFQKECKSITEMEIPPTITSTISNSLLRPNTSDCIQDVNLGEANGSSHATFAKSLSQSIQTTGTSQEKDGHCMGVAVHATSLELLRKSVCGDCGEKLSTSAHPTQKPIKLMEYLIKLITPPNGIVLDPFMGSGSTGVAAKNLGFQFIGIELNQDYFEIANRRIS
jgi:predicted RNA methylase